jgi:hypothetical protein
MDFSIYMLNVHGKMFDTEEGLVEFMEVPKNVYVVSLQPRGETIRGYKFSPIFYFYNVFGDEYIRRLIYKLDTLGTIQLLKQTHIDKDDPIDRAIDITAQIILEKTKEEGFILYRPGDDIINYYMSKRSEYEGFESILTLDKENFINHVAFLRQYNKLPHAIPYIQPHVSPTLNRNTSFQNVSSREINLTPHEKTPYMRMMPKNSIIIQQRLGLFGLKSNNFVYINGLEPEFASCQYTLKDLLTYITSQPYILNGKVVSHDEYCKVNGPTILLTMFCKGFSKCKATATSSFRNYKTQKVSTSPLRTSRFTQRKLEQAAKQFKNSKNTY